MLEFVSELPTGTRARTPNAEVTETFETLFRNEGQWAALEKGVSESRVNTWKARAGRLDVAVGKYEFTHRRDGDNFTVYGRYLNDTEI